CNIEPAAQFAELLQRLYAFTGIFGHCRVWRSYKITEGFFVASPHTPPHLVKVRQSEVIRIVDKDSIGVRYIQPAFYNGSSHQNIKLSVHKGKHQFLELFAIHLSVTHAYLRPRHEALNHTGNLLNV